MPALLGGAVLCPDDGLIFNTPLRVAAARITLGGSLPLWNPYIFSGMPLLASAQGGLLFPLNWFYLVFSAQAATNLMVVSSYALAGLGAYLYARRSGSAGVGAVVTALAWEFGGFAVGQISHVNILQTGACLPWVLWAMDAYGAGRGRKWGACLAAFVALQTFVGHQQTLAYSLLLVSAYAVVMSFVEKENRARYLFSLALVAAGVMLAAVQILPTFELLRNSLRSEATYDFFTSFSMPPRMLETFLAPYVAGGGDGRLFRAPYVGPPYYQEMAGYVGALGLMLAACAFVLRRDARTKFWAATVIACLFLALGRFAPFDFYRLIYYVPVLNLFRVPARHLMEAEFALSVLAGRGLTALAASRGESRSLRRVTVVAACVVGLTCVVVTLGRPADFRLGREAPLSLMRAPELFVPVVMACAGAWALLVLARGRRRGATVLLVALLVLDLGVWGQSSGWRASSPKSDGDLFREPETVGALRGFDRDTTSYRILTAPHPFDPAAPPVPPSVSHSTEWTLWTQPDPYMMYGIQNAAGYDGFGLARYSRLAGDMKVWGELADPDRTLRGDSRELDVLNVRYLVSMREGAGKKGGERSGGAKSGDEQANAATSAAEFPPATAQFGGAAFADSDLGLPTLGAGKRVTFSVPPVEADRVALVTNLSWSESVPDGTTVARVRVRARDGRVFDFPLRAGADTSEWAYDRPDIRSRIKHSRASVATSYAVDDAQWHYEGHTYAASFALPEKVAVTGGEIAVERSPKWPDLLLGVFRVSLMDGTRAYPISRERASLSDEVQKPNAGAANAEATNEARWRLLARTDEADIYENARVLPRAWLAPDALALGEQQTLDVIKSGRLPDGSEWEPRRAALVEPETRVKLAGGASAGRAEVTRYEPNRVDVRTRADAPSILVLSENHYPGWRAYLDGESVGVLRVDYVLRGVVVPAGAHEVRFVYRPKSALVGLLVSLLTAAALALWQSGRLPEERARSFAARLVERGKARAEAVAREEV